VADLLGKPGLLAADEMGIPCVLNNPAGSLSFTRVSELEDIQIPILRLRSDVAKCTCHRVLLFGLYN
jgi:hypothetical protein